MDVCILAGGMGTRLAGVWSWPKCLVPVGGVPILERLIEKSITEVDPDTIVISIGSQTKGLEVIDWWTRRRMLTGDTAVRFAMEPAPLGRLRALVLCLSALNPPVLVLNGDTLPLYNLRTLGDTSCIAMTHHGEHAGAYVLGRSVVEILEEQPFFQPRKDDLDAALKEWNLSLRPLQVPGFLDVGTPKGFAAAQQLDAAEG